LKKDLTSSIAKELLGLYFYFPKTKPMKKEFVVILDDDHDDSALLVESFHKYHTLEVKTFDTPSKFLKFIDQHNSSQIALIVIDLNLPEMSGVEVISMLKDRQQFDNVQILVFTTGGTPAERHFCKKHNIEKIRKPSNIEGWESFASVMAAHCDIRLTRTIR
jgi:CheY-like chemotaxis protein